MCHRACYVMLSAEDKQDVKKLAGIMIPVYASIMLALIAVVAVTGSSRARRTGCLDCRSRRYALEQPASPS